jgi:hypothetical protein
VHKWNLHQIREDLKGNSRLSMLPAEVVEIIASLTPGVMTREEAERYREDLMDERSNFTEAIGENLFSQVGPSGYASIVDYEF